VLHGEQQAIQRGAEVEGDVVHGPAQEALSAEVGGPDPVYGDAVDDFPRGQAHFVTGVLLAAGDDVNVMGFVGQVAGEAG